MNVIQADPPRTADPAPMKRRLPARSLITAQQLADVRRRSTVMGVALIVHAWALIAAAMALFAWAPNPMTFVLAVMVIGSRQLGLAILMHEGAHGGLAKDERPRVVPRRLSGAQATVAISAGSIQIVSARGQPPPRAWARGTVIPAPVAAPRQSTMV